MCRLRQSFDDLARGCDLEDLVDESGVGLDERLGLVGVGEEPDHLKADGADDVVALGPLIKGRVLLDDPVDRAGELECSFVAELGRVCLRQAEEALRACAEAERFVGLLLGGPVAGELEVLVDAVTPPAAQDRSESKVRTDT